MLGPDSADLPAGHRLFARYAHGPNALGYCGPHAAAVLRSVATGGSADVDLRDIARQFSGAWPYQAVMADLAGYDALDEEVVRGYWTGGALTQAISRDRFGEELLDRIRPQAGHYWAHLTSDLLEEVAPTHAFHVLSVYPWSRLLPTGRNEPLEVLESCRIGWGTVVETQGDDAVVLQQKLVYDSGRLFLGEPEPTSARYRDEHGPLVPTPAAGDVVAIHWGQVCDFLTAYQAATLAHWTEWQLQAIAPRLAAAHAATMSTPSGSSPEPGRA